MPVRKVSKQALLQRDTRGQVKDMDIKTPRTKKELHKELRNTWTLKPITKVKESAKLYTRKPKHPKEIY